MKELDEIRDYLLEHRTDEDGDLDLRDLDFSDFDGNVYINGMKVKETLFQGRQTAGRNLFQGRQTVGGDLYQDFQTVEGKIYQDKQEEE